MLQGEEINLTEVTNQKQIPVEQLLAMEKNQQGLGAFVHLLQSSNQIRNNLDKGRFDGQSSMEAFDNIWSIHTGSSDKEKALAFTEGGGYTLDEWRDALERQTRPLDAATSVRLIEGMKPMLFDLPEPAKSQVIKIFFDFADKILQDPQLIPQLYRSKAYIPAVILQAHLNFLHPKQDGNGRTSEDWSLWWQKELVRRAEVEAKSKKPASTGWLSLSVVRPEVERDSIRSWYHHGLRYRYADNNFSDYTTVPPFLKEELEEVYLEGRKTMEKRIVEMNKFRREMYQFLIDKIEFKGNPKEFEEYIKQNSDKVVAVFQDLYSSSSNIDWNLFIEQVITLQQTGEYSYKSYPPAEVIKPELL